MCLWPANRVLHRIAYSAVNGSMPNPVNRLLPLVHNTNSIHRKREVINPETGEIQRLMFNQRCRGFAVDLTCRKKNQEQPSVDNCPAHRLGPVDGLRFDSSPPRQDPLSRAFF